MTRIHDDMEQYGSIEDAEKHNEEVNRRMEMDARQESPLTRRGKKKGDKGKYFSQIVVDESTHRTVCSMASESGMRLQDFVGMIIRLWIADPANMKSSAYKIENLHTRMKRRVEYEEMVRSGASEYAIGKSVDLADMLAEMCDEMGIDPEQAKSDAREDPMVEAIANLKSDPGSKRNLCAKWMISFMKANGFRVLAKIGNAAALREGYAKEVVTHARNTVGVLSVPDPKDNKFYWIFPENKRVVRSILLGEE